MGVPHSYRVEAPGGSLRIHAGERGFQASRRRAINNRALALAGAKAQNLKKAERRFTLD